MKTPSETFNILQRKVRHTHNDNATLFSPPIRDAEYWLFSDLYNLFGQNYVGTHENIPDTMRHTITESDFNKLPKQNRDKIKRPENFYEFYKNHITTITSNYEIITPTQTIEQHDGINAQLSRYACWKLVHRHPKLIFAQLYFMMPHTRFQDLCNHAYKFARIHNRTELSRYEKMANGIAFRNRANMRQFNHTMHQAFFQAFDFESLKSRYDISGTMLDYMGSNSMLAHRIALSNAIRKWDTCPQMQFSQFVSILRQELTTQRSKMIQKTGRAPEQDFSKIPISQISGELRKIEREFINKFAFQKIRI